MVIGILLQSTDWCNGVKQHRPRFSNTWMGHCFSMSIFVDSPSDETLNRGPLVPLLRRQYEFPYGINIVQFSILAIHNYVVPRSICHKSPGTRATYIEVLLYVVCPPPPPLLSEASGQSTQNQFCNKLKVCGTRESI